jgi:hypothetical protein
MEIGMGQDGMFDCSGLVIYALSTVIGRHIDQWPPIMRHTRQMWGLVDKVPQAYAPGVDSSGDLLVIRRRWDLPNGGSRWAAAHVGLITGLDETNMPIFLQAQARERRVIERPVRTIRNVLGTLRLCDLVAAV